MKSISELLKGVSERLFAGPEQPKAPPVPAEVFTELAKCTACDGTGVSTGTMAPAGDACPRCQGTRQQLNLVGIIMPNGLNGEPMHFGRTKQ